MNPEDEEMFSDCTVDIIQELKVGAKFKALLMKKRVLPANVIFEIFEGEDREENIFRLVQTLMQEKSANLDSFLESLEETGQNELAKTMRSCRVTQAGRVAARKMDKAKAITEISQQVVLDEQREKDLKGGVSSNQSPRRTIDLDSAGELLNDLMSGKALSNETVFDWVEENIGSHVTHPRFIHALARAAFTDSLLAGATSSHMKFDDDKLRNRCTLMQRYVDRQATLEMQVLYAVQHVVHDLEHPSGLLSSFFEFIYEEELVSEEAFYAWRDDKNVNPEFTESRGIALQSVKSFFDWLAMADNEQQQPTS